MGWTHLQHIQNRSENSKLVIEPHTEIFVAASQIHFVVDREEDFGGDGDDQQRGNY